MRRLLLLFSFVFSLLLLTGCDDLRETTREIKGVIRDSKEVMRTVKDVKNGFEEAMDIVEEFKPDKTAENTVNKTLRERGNVPNSKKANKKNEKKTNKNSDMIEDMVSFEEYVNLDSGNVAKKVPSLKDKDKVSKLLTLLSGRGYGDTINVLTSNYEGDIIEEDDYLILGHDQNIVISKSSIRLFPTVKGKVKAVDLIELLFSKDVNISKSKKSKNVVYKINKNMYMTVDKQDGDTVYILTIK